MNQFYFSTTRNYRDKRGTFDLFLGTCGAALSLFLDAKVAHDSLDAVDDVSDLSSLPLLLSVKVREPSESPLARISFVWTFTN